MASFLRDSSNTFCAMAILLVFALVSAILALGIVSQPLDKPNEVLLGTQKIAKSLFQTFELYEQYAAAAYCPHNYNAMTDHKVKCFSGNCPRVESANVMMLHSFNSTVKTDTSGYVAIDKTNSLIVVAFRGSESIRNYVAAVSVFLEDIPLCDDCEAATGYWQAWGEVSDGVTDAVEIAHKTNPRYKVVVAGHSLGGAVATLATAELRNAGHVVDLASFGAPRVGNNYTTAFIEKQAPKKGNNYRIVKYGDYIPALPWAPSSFRHINPEYLITAKNLVRPTLNDVVMKRASEFAEIIIGAKLKDYGEAHESYFNRINACYRSGFTIPYKRINEDEP